MGIKIANRLLCIAELVVGMRRSNVRLCSISSLLAFDGSGGQCPSLFGENKMPRAIQGSLCARTRNGSLSFVSRSNERVPTLVPKA